MEKETRQTIVWRKDLKVHKGKIGAQCAHASLGGVLKLMRRFETNENSVIRSFEYSKDSIIGQWLEVSFTKIVLACESEEELLELYNKALEAGLNTVLITDNGLTEFNGVKTNTCISIGPAYKEDIDKITSHLKPL